MAIWFYSKTPSYEWLSNSSDCRFTLDDVRWPSVEHRYQAQKYPGTPAAAEIRRAESADRAPKLGQNRSLTPRADWDAVKLEVMRRAVEAKFTQARDLGERLVETGGEELIHESNTDTFWGRTREGLGDNWLGVILMQVRAGLQGVAEQSDAPKSPVDREFGS
ncbi:MAG: NADAR family protein [Planctomycetota bacterium]